MSSLTAEERRDRVLFLALAFVVIAGLAFLTSCGGHAEAQEVSTSLDPAEVAAPLPEVEFPELVQEPQGPDPEPTIGEHRNPFASDWLELGYILDSRHVRGFTFEGHAHPCERADLYGQLDLESGLDQDASRFALRTGAYWRAEQGPAGAVLHYEDFNGSWNEVARVGLYWDPSLGGEVPFCRLVALPLATEGGGAMARAMFDVSLREKWSVRGFMEHAWGDDGGDFTAAQPELRYEIRPGVFGVLQYRRDERRDESEGVALGLKAAL